MGRILNFARSVLAFGLAVLLLVPVVVGAQPEVGDPPVVSGSWELSGSVPVPTCPAGYEPRHWNGAPQVMCGKRVTEEVEGSCDDSLLPAPVVVRGRFCVSTRIVSVDKVLVCVSDPGDPPAWSLTVDGRCTRVVTEEYQHDTGRQRRVPPYWTTEARQVSSTVRVRVPPYWTTEARQVSSTVRVRVAPFWRTITQLEPYTYRVRVAPFYETRIRRVRVVSRVRVRDRCVRWNHQHGGCLSWSYKTITSVSYRSEPRRVAVFNYETRTGWKPRQVTVPAYNYEDRTVWSTKHVRVPFYNYENRIVWRTEQVDVEVFNYETIYETRTRDVTQEKLPAQVCPADTEPDGQRCLKRVETKELAEPTTCSAGHNWTVSGWTCSRLDLREPTGCTAGYRLKPANTCRPEERILPRGPVAPSRLAPFGPVPSRVGYANDTFHSYTSIEENAREREYWTKRFKGAEDIYNQTDLFLYNAGDFNYNADVQWHVNSLVDLFLEGILPQVPAAIFECLRDIVNGICPKGQITINFDVEENLSDLLQDNLVCHELGHSVGFDDGGNAGNSCMTGGDNNKLNAWEINVLNSHY